MYIQPNSVIRLLTGVPLDNTYAHTIYFETKQAQAEYFASKTKTGCTFNNQTYQRVNKGTMRLEVLADDIYDCNYLMFQNTSFGTKWFYAFVTSIEYVSNKVSEITYEIDVMQTWFFDVTLLQSFVEREHSATDIVGENIVPEPVNIGEYFNTLYDRTEMFDDFACILVCPYKRIETPIGTVTWTNLSSDLPIPPNTVDKQKTILYYTVLKTDAAIGQALFELNGERDSIFGNPKSESIVTMYIVPSIFVSNYETYDVLDGNTRTEAYTYYSVSDIPGSLGDYTPKNKKLLTYPYNKFVLETGDGCKREYAFEFFKDSVSFNIEGTVLQTVSFRATPINYKNNLTNKAESVILTDFPMMAYVVDTFKAWLAQNKTSLALQGISGFIGAGSGIGDVISGSKMLTPVTQVISKKGQKVMSEGYEQMIQSGVTGISGVLSNIISHGINPMSSRGSQDGSLEIRNGIKDFCGSQYYVNPRNAQIIDDFFSVYGYATHRVKVPNRNVRPHWTYVKTIDINIESNAPADDTKAIASIYDHGITFWRNASEVGNYSLNNSPV